MKTMGVLDAGACLGGHLKARSPAPARVAHLRRSGEDAETSNESWRVALRSARHCARAGPLPRELEAVLAIAIYFL